MESPKRERKPEAKESECRDDKKNPSRVHDDETLKIVITCQASEDNEENTRESFEDEYDVPKDTGWSWFVMLGTLLEMILLIGILKAGGIIFVAFQEKFNSTSSLTSLLSTITNAVYSITAPVALCIGKRVTTARVLVSIGTFILAAAFIITSQATDIRILFFSHGILQGISSAFMLPITTVTLANYFDKKRGFANSLSLSGGSLGGLMFAPLITYLLREYGYQGCFLIIAGILLNGLVCGALFRPQSFYRKKAKTRTPTVKGKDTIERRALITDISSTPTDLNRKIKERLLSPVSKSEAFLNKPEVGCGTYFTSGIIGKMHTKQLINDNQNGMRKRASSDAHRRTQFTSAHPNSSQKNLNISREYMCGSVLDINTELSKQHKACVPHIKTNNANKDTDGRMSIKAMLKILITSFDFKLFRNPIFCILQVSGFLICGNIVLFPVYIAPHARDTGQQANGIALIVTVLSSTDFISRVVIALIADRGWMRRSNITATSVFLVALASFFLRFYDTFGTLMLYGVILGLFSGVYFSLYPVLIVDYLTIHKLPPTLGFMALFHGASVSLFYYVIGYLRDVTGSYIAPFHMMSCLCLVGSLLHLSLPFVERCQKRRENSSIK